MVVIALPTPLKTPQVFVEKQREQYDLLYINFNLWPSFCDVFKLLCSGHRFNITYDLCYISVSTLYSRMQYLFSKLLQKWIEF